MFSQSAPQDFKKLMYSLKMKGSFEAATPLIWGHLESVKSELENFLKHDPIVTAELRNALAQLPQESLYRLIGSPYLCELLLICKNQDRETLRPLRQQILQGLIAEIRRVNPDFSHPLRPQWTFNGDLVLDAQILADFPPLHSHCGIGLNYQSYAHNTGKSGIGGYSFEMALEHKERIDTAKALIEKVSKGAASLIDTFTTTIQFRLNENRPNVVNSSTHTSIGLIRCENFHKLHTDLPEVVDMLVHESIHQYLHLFEEQLFPFVRVEDIPPERLESRDYPSPWSGNPLDLRSYTHAILVWFGLAHFWEQWLTSGIRHPEVTVVQAQQKLTEARFGFVNSASVLDNLGRARQWLASEYVRTIEDLQKSFKTKAAV